MNREYSLVTDAWMREAQEATKLVEDIESRIKNKDLAEESTLRDPAQKKLIEAGVKLDRLESLLHNPHSKPILYVPSLSHLAPTSKCFYRTREDLEFRWKMLSDLQLRTRALALSLYTLTKRTGGLLASTSGTNGTTNSHRDQALTGDPNSDLVDQRRKLLSNVDPELLIPLSSEDATLDQVQFNQEGVLDILFDSWSSCTAIHLGYPLCSYIIYILWPVNRVALLWDMECIVTSIEIGKFVSFIETSVFVNAVNRSYAFEKHGRHMSKGNAVKTSLVSEIVNLRRTTP
ncbi:unnamed protein product [Dovyalis caffra]|uniref:Uncharacterized protein n=1 Tax=Dovyalis caffra TaxID=77055 RepID=A0AAV1RW65_9ROSI|nr:unnamed protein product [Dovyalis caffra]